MGGTVSKLPSPPGAPPVPGASGGLPGLPGFPGSQKKKSLTPTASGAPTGNDASNRGSPSPQAKKPKPIFASDPSLFGGMYSPTVLLGGSATGRTLLGG